MLGGYDVAKTSGSGLIGTLDYTNCGGRAELGLTKVTILNNGNNQESANLLMIDKLDSCIDVALPGLIFTSGLDGRIRQTLGIPSNDTFAPANAPNYDMRLTFGNFTIQIPAAQLLPCNTSIGDNGQLQSDYSQKVIGLSDSTVLQATLGRSFLFSSYLLQNYETNMFTIWPVNPNGLNSQQIVTIAGNGTSCGSLTLSSGSSSSTSISGSAIAGIVIGVLALLALLALLSLLTSFFLRRPRQKRSTNQQEPLALPLERKFSMPLVRVPCQGGGRSPRV